MKRYPASRHCFDQLLIAIFESPAQLDGALHQGIIGDETVRPDGLYELLFADQATWVLYQVFQRIVNLWTKPDLLPRLQQASPLHVERKRAKTIDEWIACQVSASPAQPEHRLSWFFGVSSALFRYASTPSSYLGLEVKTQRFRQASGRTEPEADRQLLGFSKAAKAARSRVVTTGTDEIRSEQGDIEMSTAQVPTLDMNKLNAFIGQFVTDLGASVHAGMVVIGEKLGLYKALAHGPTSSSELAAKTGTDERYLREWLASQAAGGYITYDEQTRKFSLTAEQAFTLAQEDSPAYLPGAFELALGSLASVPRIAESFRTGAGMGWHEHDDGVFHGCEKFFRPGYAANLVSSWIPSLDDVNKNSRPEPVSPTSAAAKVHRRCSWQRLFPTQDFFGFDYHDKSIEAARDSAKRQLVNDRVSFEVSKAKDFPGKDYDFVAVFDCLHDMGDPVGAAAHVRQLPRQRRNVDDRRTLRERQLKDNLNPVGRVYYSF